MSRIETVDSIDGKTQWLEWLAGMPTELQDIYFGPDYVDLHRTEAGTRALLFVFEEAGEVWLYPFLLRPTPLRAFHAATAVRYDIESAYGYGGPLSTSDHPAFLNQANSAFDEWCRDLGIVAEFVRFHPMVENHRWLAADVDVVPDRETVSLDLRKISRGRFPMSKNAMNMVHRAERSGLRVEACTSELAFSKFKELHVRTLERLDADSFYYFGDSYFRSLALLAQKFGWLVVASLEGTVVAAAVFLLGGKWMHYHLSASDPDNAVPGATNAIIHHAATEGHRRGLERLHLGGGTTRDPEDSLLKFKRRMATDTHSFFVGTRVHDVETYRALRADWEKLFPNLIEDHGNKLMCYRFVTPG